MPGPARLVAVTAVIAVVAAACGSDSSGGPTGPTAPRAREDAETLTTNLAASQVTASTVARPDTPPPCDPAEITTWTAAVDIGADRATAIVRLRNDGTAWCEIDLRGSRRIDPRIEPDLWLEPGAWGDLWIGPDDSATCGQPKVVVSAEITIGGVARTVPTAAVVPCEWTLTAMYGVDAPVGPCDAASIAAVRVGDELVVRNTSFRPCTVGALVEVDGVATAVRAEPAPVEVRHLAGGDTIAFAVTAGSAACDPVDAVARFDAGVDVAVRGLESCDTVSVGAGEPFYDGVTGPLAGFPAGLDGLEVVAVLAALDPLAER